MVEGAIRRYGVEPNKSERDLPFPEIPEEYLPHFVRGLLDGDGHVNKIPYGLSFFGSPRFMRTLHNKLRYHLGLKNNQVDVSGKIVKLRWESEQDTEKLRDWLYPVGSFLLGQRKKIGLFRQFSSDIPSYSPAWDNEGYDLEPAYLDGEHLVLGRKIGFEFQVYWKERATLLNKIFPLSRISERKEENATTHPSSSKRLSLAFT